MMMSHDANKRRKTFVLKCDKPRYDGGVEIDLENYFGKRLNKKGNLKNIALNHLETEVPEAAKKYRQEDLLKKLNLHPEIEEALMEDTNHFDLDEALRLGQAEEKMPGLSALSIENRGNACATKPVKQSAKRALQAKTPLLLPASNPKKEKVKEALMEGPLQVAIGATGLLTSMLALCSMRFAKQPGALKKQASKLFRDCSKVFLQGVWKTLMLPCKAIQATFA